MTHSVPFPTSGDTVHEHMLIADGHGGVLALDATQPELVRLAEACTHVLEGTVPPGSALLKVHVAGDIFFVRRAALGDVSGAVLITQHGTFTGEVTLAPDIAQVLVALISRSHMIPPPRPTGAAAQRYDQ